MPWILWAYILQHVAYWQTLFAVWRCNEIQVSRYRECVYMHCHWTIPQCCSWNLIPFWSCDVPTMVCRRFPTAKPDTSGFSWGGYLLSTVSLLILPLAINKRESFYFFLPFVCFGQFVLVIEWQREITHMFQLCVPSEFIPKVGPNPSFLSGSSNIYITI